MKKVILGAGLVMALSACGGGDVGPQAARNVTANALSGSFGDVSVTTADALHIEFVGESQVGFSWTSLMLTAPRAEGGALMGGISVSNLDLASLDLGTKIHATNPYARDAGAPIFEGDPAMEDEPVYEAPTVEIEGPDGAAVDVGDDAMVDGIGCSGDEVYDWQKDEPAEEVDIEIVEGEEPGDRAIEFTLTYANGQELTGTALLADIETYDMGDDYMEAPAAE